MILFCNKDWIGGPLTILKHEDTLFYQKENALPMNRTRCQSALIPGKRSNIWISTISYNDLNIKLSPTLSLKNSHKRVKCKVLQRWWSGTEVLHLKITQNSHVDPLIQIQLYYVSYKWIMSAFHKRSDRIFTLSKMDWQFRTLKIITPLHLQIKHSRFTGEK